MIKLIFKGVPKAVQSFRRGRWSNYQEDDVKNWKKAKADEASYQLPESWKLLGGPLAIEVTFIFPPLKAFNKEKVKIQLPDGSAYKDTKINLLRSGGKIYKVTKPDLTDNLMKGLVDALSGVVWIQDQQIAKVRSEKVYGLHALTIMTITELSETIEPALQPRFDF